MKNLMVILLIILLAGCSFIPEYQRPSPPIPEEWPKGEAYSSIKYEGVTKASKLSWKEFLRDDKLCQIVEKALKNNRDLRLAALNAEHALAYYGIQRTELFPALDVSGTSIRERTPAELSNTDKTQTTSRYSVTIGVTSWEIDLFGRIRSLSEVALEQYFAQEENFKAAKLSLISAVATAYYIYATDMENLKLAKGTLKTQQDMYGLIKKRYEVGIASEIDLYRAHSQVNIAEEAVARYTQALAQDRNLLDLLMGEIVPDEYLPEGLESIKPPQEISPGLSSEVLLRRPDVMSAEYMLRAYNAQIGAARAAFFPRISLTTVFGTASSELSGLFEAGTKTWKFQSSAVMPIFDARVWAAHKAAKVEREIALANYEKTIQTAFREVADTLAIKGTIDEQVKAVENTVISLEQIYELSKIRYEKGIDGYLSVLDAQRSLFQAQQQLNSLRLLKYLNFVSLYKVLGGGLEE